MKLKLICRPNPVDRNASPKYYAHVENEGVVELHDLAKQIAKYSSLSSGDVTSTLENMVDAASLFLLMGKGVRIGHLGILRIILKSNGADSPEMFNRSLIQRVKIHFTPSTQLKKQLEDITYDIKR